MGFWRIENTFLLLQQPRTPFFHCELQSYIVSPTFLLVHIDENTI